MLTHEKLRKGFTLVELLVVMSLIVVLAAFTIAFFPSAASSEREARAASTVQGWLNIAKQRAMRDRRPAGLRLWTKSINVNGTPLNNVVTDCQYIEQPEDFTGGAIQSAVPFQVAPGYTPMNTLGVGPAPQVDLVNGYSPVTLPIDSNMKYWSIQPGDYLELRGGGLLHRILQVGVPTTTDPPNTASNTNYIVIQPPLSFQLLPATQQYRIIRSPRVVGDETLKLPSDAIIDLNTPNNGVPFPNVMTEGTGFHDILFAPNGAVISRGVTGSNIHLWVRVPAQEQPTNLFRGDPTIVSIFVRTGLVGAYPPDPNGPNPYSYVK